MQPYFMPYIGYFSLIKNADIFILLDEVQFIRHGWIERNRILSQDGDWQYISVPLVKHGQKTLIKDIKINNKIEWKSKILSKLVHYRKAPYYQEILKLIHEVLSEEYDDITHLDFNCLKKICNYIGIATPIYIFSEMNIEIEEAQAPDEWALNICKALPDVDEYWNPIGGVTFFNTEKYCKEGINIKFLEMVDEEYKQRGDSFIKQLSIIDVLMYNSPEKTLAMLERFKLL